MKREFDVAEDLITPRIATQLIPAFNAAYEMAFHAADSVDFLGGVFRGQTLPHLINYAVDYELRRRAEAGIIPFECSVIPNSRRNHLHIELRRNGTLLTVSQTHNQLELPRNCEYRNSYCMDGQYALEGFDDGLRSSNKEVYAILTHVRGNRAPQYLMCGIPTPDMTAWAQLVDLFNVSKGLHIVDESPISNDIQLSFVHHLKRVAEQNQ